MQEFNSLERSSEKRGLAEHAKPGTLREVGDGSLLSESPA